MAITGYTGTLTHANTVTLNGSGFGSKTNAGPMLYDDFSALSNGTVIATPGGTGTVPPIHQGTLAGYSDWDCLNPSIFDIVASNSTPKTRGSLHARVNMTSNDWNSLLITGLTFSSAGHKMYVSMYYRYRHTGAAYARQTKAILHRPSGGDNAYFSTAFDNCEAGGWRAHITDIADDDGFGPTGPSVDNEWIRLEEYLVQSGVSVADGNYSCSMIRNTVPQILSGGFTSTIMRTSASSWSQLLLGAAYHDFCASGNTATVDVTECYVDDTPQRVELGNASTWAACTKREIQRATSWSATSIDVKWNSGYFADGASGWLYVIDSSNSPLFSGTGFAVTLDTSGSGSSSTPALSMMMQTLTPGRSAI